MAAVPIASQSRIKKKNNVRNDKSYKYKEYDLPAWNAVQFGKVQLLGGAYRLHLQDRKVSQTINQHA
jgi:hypothetical protein